MFTCLVVVKLTGFSFRFFFTEWSSVQGSYVVPPTVKGELWLILFWPLLSGSLSVCTVCLRGSCCVWVWRKITLFSNYFSQTQSYRTTMATFTGQQQTLIFHSSSCSTVFTTGPPARLLLKGVAVPSVPGWVKESGAGPVRWNMYLAYCFFSLHGSRIML